MILCRLQTFMEPLVRRVVKEEVDLALRKYVISMKWNYDKDTRSSSPRSLNLQFSSTISLPVFTGARIDGEDGNNLKVLLVDSLSGKVVSQGHGSSAKVEIVVLEGDFDGDARDNWTIEEYNKNNIVKEREGKKSLLNGDVFLTLEEGIGVVRDVSFTDNSSWTRSRKFRLGARIVDKYDGIKVRAAKSESFVVRDHRGELYKKHHPPSLSDEVWRLEKIGKEGAFHKRLIRAGVYTVKDFLFLYSLDPTKLRNVLGTGISAKMWEVTVEHARTCVLDNKTYLFSPSGLQHKTGVVFNVVGQVMGLLCEGQYIASEKLSETEKDEAHKLVILASTHQDEVLLFDDKASCLNSISQLTTTPYSSDLPFGDSDAVKGSFSQNIGEGDNLHLVSFSPDMTSTIYSGPCLDDFDLLDSMDGRFAQSLNFPSQASSSFTYDADSIAQALFEDDHLDYFNPSSLPNSCMALSSELHSGSNNLERATGYPLAKSQRRRWTMLFSVLKMVFTRKTRKQESPRL
ncbi:hypothetical protein Leryth_019511 [Lithospermum erythrorhizon]|nr:hypothetical protein Leryth_019511 [Lithospermum erythrorhizon]